MELKASIRSIYKRTAFQQADSNKVRRLGFAAGFC